MEGIQGRCWCEVRICKMDKRTPARGASLSRTFERYAVATAARGGLCRERLPSLRRTPSAARQLKEHLDANAWAARCIIRCRCICRSATRARLQPGDFPMAEKAACECLSLPIYPELTDAQIQRVAVVIKEFSRSNCNNVFSVCHFIVSKLCVLVSSWFEVKMPPCRTRTLFIFICTPSIHCSMALVVWTNSWTRRMN